MLALVVSMEPLAVQAPNGDPRLMRQTRIAVCRTIAMPKKAKLLPALAFSVAFVPIAEIAAIGVVARHDFAMSSIPPQHHSSTVDMIAVQDPFSVSAQPVHAAGSELIRINSTPIWVSIH